MNTIPTENAEAALALGKKYEAIADKTTALKANPDAKPEVKALPVQLWRDQAQSLYNYAQQLPGDHTAAADAYQALQDKLNAPN